MNSFAACSEHTFPLSFLSFLFLHSLSPSISTKPFSLSMLLSFLNSRALCLSCSYLLSVCLSISPFLSFFLCPPPHLSISLSIYPLLNVGELRDHRYTDRRTYAFHGSVAKLLCNCLACTRFTRAHEKQTKTKDKKHEKKRYQRQPFNQDSQNHINYQLSLFTCYFDFRNSFIP